MADDALSPRGCQHCGSENIERIGVIVAESPPHGLAARPPSDPEIRRVIEQKYRCRDCGEFCSSVQNFPGRGE